MNKQLKQLFSLFLAFALVLSLVGCGQKETVRTPDSSQSKTDNIQ